MSGQGGENEEPIVKEGVTMQIITVKETFARVMLVYQTPQSIVSTDCVEDWGQIGKDLNFYKQAYRKCSNDLDREKSRANSLSTDNSTLSIQVGEFQNNWNRLPAKLNKSPLWHLWNIADYHEQ